MVPKSGLFIFSLCILILSCKWNLEKVDLSVERIEVSPEDPKVSDSITISIVIKNNSEGIDLNGLDLETLLQLRVKSSDTTTSPVLFNSKITLPSSRTIRFQYDTLLPEVKDYLIIAIVDPNNELVEEDENNNRAELPFKTEWKCGDDFVDIRDGQVYRTDLVGGNCWMMDNLNFADTVIEDPKDYMPTEEKEQKVEMVCYNCEKFGGLYSWEEAMGYQYILRQSDCEVEDTLITGICPYGWHISTDEEWRKLEMALGMEKDSTCKTGDSDMRGASSDLGKELVKFLDIKKGNKFSSFVNCRNTDSCWTELPETRYWTSLNETNTNLIFKAYYRRIKDNQVKGNDGIGRNLLDIRDALCIRCVKDQE